ncbi:MAG: hypothetical protein PHF60_01365 [Candidatus ainarchaeum sp.]|nr:hypothetical protein [Candidatus ainarchaeum sp.]
MKFSHALGLIVAFMVLAGCCITPPGNEGTGSTGQTGNEDIDQGQTGGNVAGDSGGEIVDVGGTTSGGMSDPSKCNNLPPQQMADCLEESMGN